jgi:hypothetical protein
MLKEEKCDLLVFEGMGRAIHTNFAAQFSIGTDSQKTQAPYNSSQKNIRHGLLHSMINMSRELV